MALLATVLAAKPEQEEKAKNEDEEETQEQIDHKEMIMLLKKAKLAQHREQYQEAEEFYHRALFYAGMHGEFKSWSEEDVVKAKTYIFDALANLAMSRGQFEKAEGLFKETMKGLLQKGYAKTDNAIVDISLKLAMIYVMMQRYADAEQGYQFCLQTQRDKVESLKAKDDKVDEDTAALLGLTTDSYARFLLMQAKTSEALEQLNIAIQIAEQVFDKHHSQVAVLYNDKATVQAMLGNFQDAKDSVMTAIYIAKKIDSSDLPSFIANLGTILIHTNGVAEAEQHCKRAAKLAKKYNNKDATDQAKICLDEIRKRQRKVK